MSVALRFAARSNIGLGRYKNNQDSGFAGNHVLAVCDGMGGHAGGDVASSIAVAHLAMLDGEAVGSDAPQELVETIRAAHAAMLERAHEDPEVSGLATTVTTLFKFGGKLALAHIGDSRAYLLTDDSLVQVTKDHTFVQWLIDQGQITEDEAESHPQRSVIMRVLGDVEADDQIDTSVRAAELGDRWMLCSDGLSGCVSHDTIQRSLTSIADPGECADHLIDLALKAGGQDNITCVIADVVAPTETQNPAPAVVGAAGENTKEAQQRSTPASRAAALTAPASTGETPVVSVAPDTPKGRNWRPWIIGGALLAVLGICVGAAYGWTQSQYYVGPADKKVGIYQGVSQNLGSISLSELKETTMVPLDMLSADDRRSVEEFIATGNYDEAKAVALRLLKASKLCKEVPVELVQVPTTIEASPTQSVPDPSPTPLSGSTPGPQPTSAAPQPTSAAPDSTTSPAPTLEPKNVLGQPLPDECKA